MQLTRFDRWLCKKFVYEIHVETLRPLESIPARIRAVDRPDVPGRRYKHLYVSTNNDAMDALIRKLKDNNQMYTTQIVNRDAWYVPMIAPKGKSLTWRLFSMTLFTIFVFFVLVYLKGLVEDPEFRKNFMEAIELLKG